MSCGLSYPTPIPTKVISVPSGSTPLGVTGTGSTGALGSMLVNFNFTKSGDQVTMGMNTATAATVTSAVAGTYTFPAGTIPPSMVPSLPQILPTLVTSGGVVVEGSALVNPDGSIVLGLVHAASTWSTGSAGAGWVANAGTSVTYTTVTPLA